MSEELSARPAQLRPAQRAERANNVAAHLERATPVLASHGKVGAAGKTLRAATKLESRAAKLKDAVTAHTGRGQAAYGESPDVTAKGRNIDVRVC